MSIRKRLRSFKFAFRGLSILLLTQPNARIHLVAATVAVSGGFYFRISVTEWMLIFISIGMVLAMEAMNSALESLTDLVSPGHHPLAGRAKDLAAAAVLLTAIAALAVGIQIFLPKLFALYQ